MRGPAVREPQSGFSLLMVVGIAAGAFSAWSIFRSHSPEADGMFLAIGLGVILFGVFIAWA
ncbi:hypothetical protein, partial [Gordonibacter sp.]|uniref:hypothetical protein n=1 Tax=Gordonibacter sp. TaxID=1968902 RepID=UPI002FC63856